MDISFDTVVRNLNRDLPALWRFMTAATFLTGIWFAFRAIYHFKEYGELRVMMSVNTDMRRPLMSLFVAVVLLYWPSLVHMMLQSTYGSTAIAEYIPTSVTSQHQRIIALAGHIIQFIGFVAFIRGIVLLARIGQQGAQPGMFGKAMTHIFGGIFAVNIFGTWKVIESIFT